MNLNGEALWFNFTFNFKLPVILALGAIHAMSYLPRAPPARRGRELLMIYDPREFNEKGKVGEKRKKENVRKK